MGATLVAPPFDPPEINYSRGDDWRKIEQDYTDRLAMRARARNEVDPNHLVGRIVRWQRADGYASYMVWQVSPLKLIHLDLGDGYAVEGALLRGLTLAEVKRMVAWDDSWHHATHDVNEDFYGSLTVGQIVHYHDSFGRFVRCEVVSAPGWKSKLGTPGVAGIALKPIALIGNWAAYDLPQRMNNGEIRLGYHAENIADGELMQPHAGNIFENPTFKAGTAFADIDPRTMDPIDLTLPPPTAAEERLATLATRFESIHQITGERPADAQGYRDALDQVQIVLNEEFER